MRRRCLMVATAGLLLACGATEPDEHVQYSGLWQVTEVNGQALPALTASGDTFYAGYLTLYIGPTGSTAASAERHCAGRDGSRQAFLNRLLWSVAREGLLTMTYPDFTGAAFPVDSAIVDGDAMQWHAKGSEARLGTSNWGLVRISHDQTQDPPAVCAV